MAYKRGDRIAGFSASFLPARIVFHFTLTLVRLVNRLVFRLKVEGREHLQQVTSGILVSNHTLVLDPGIIANVIRPSRTYFTMLEETACIPLLGTFVRLLGAVPIPSHAAAIRTMERALRTEMRDLPFVHVYPEGECYLWNQQIEEFQPGAFYLACRLGLPIVPLTIVLHRRRWLGRESFHLGGREIRIPPQVTVVIGEAIQAGETRGKNPRREAVELSREIHELMQRTIDRERGCKSLSRGRMPRLALQHPQAAAQAG
ncbi:MAG: 1-acyl-sn-glycerol-3-phosphate acyltransferase [Spirochaetales bacterium]|nr:1-acyl-sn-glycerol-3-phosphate acyltransferase [Spirochaetales bacterium]